MLISCTCCTHQCHRQISKRSEYSRVSSRNSSKRLNQDVFLSGKQWLFFPHSQCPAWIEGPKAEDRQSSGASRLQKSCQEPLEIKPHLSIPELPISEVASPTTPNNLVANRAQDSEWFNLAAGVVQQVSALCKTTGATCQFYSMFL